MGPLSIAPRFVVPLLLAVAGIASCAGDFVEKDEAQKDILLASLAKTQECGAGPGYFLPLLKDQDRNAVAGCVIAIVNAPCPFTEYPLLCIRVYGEDVPGTVKIVTE